jgi:hypothetical protein
VSVFSLCIFGLHATLTTTTTTNATTTLLLIYYYTTTTTTTANNSYPINIDLRIRRAEMNIK